MERLSIETYIGECHVKCAQIILGSRVYQAEHVKPAPDRRSGRWFLLEVEELAGLSARLEPWRRDVYAPLVIEIYIQPWDTSAVMPGGTVGTARQNSSNATGGMLLERWTLNYTAGQSSTQSASRAAMDTAAVYKRLILLIRSLYSYVRVLPAYRMYRACKRRKRELFNTNYSLSTAPLPLLHHQQQQQQQRLTGAGTGSAAAAAGGSAGSDRMCQFSFSPVETMSGVFGVTVEYQPATAVHFLEQTTPLPCTPRIISDYVDGPYARSAPNTNHLAGRLQTAGSTTAAAAAAGGGPGADGLASSRTAGEEAGTLSFLRSPQHQAPLVRHSWSSRDVAAPPVVQRGFNPLARTNSLNSSGGSQQQQQQQQQLMLHRRSMSQGSQGSYSPHAAAAAAGGTGSGSAAAAGAGGSASLMVGSNSPVVFHGPSSLGRPPLPHSPATQNHQHHPAVVQAGFNTPNPSPNPGYNSLMPGGLGAAAALPPASPGTPSGSSRGCSPLLRCSSANAAAVSAGAAAAAGSRSGGGNAAALCSTSLPHGGGGAGVQQLSRLGSSLSNSSSSPTGPRVLGFNLQQQQGLQGAHAVNQPQARQQGFVVREDIAGQAGRDGSSRPSSAADQQQQQQAGDGAQESEAVGAAAAVGEVPLQQQQQDEAPASCSRSSPDRSATEALDAASAVAAVSFDGQQPAAAAAAGGQSPESAAAAAGAARPSCPRVVSAPMMIPGKGKSRARSVTDLPLMAAEVAAAAAAGGTAAGHGAFGQRRLESAQQQAAADGGSGITGRLAWLQQGQRAGHAAADGAAGSEQAGGAFDPLVPGTQGRSSNTSAFSSALSNRVRVQGGLSAAGLSSGQQTGSSSSSSLLRVQQQQQQHLVQAPSSAPAAPRGMLGQLLSGSGHTSPSFSPPFGAAGGSRVQPAAAAPGSSASDEEQGAGRAAGADVDGSGTAADSEGDDSGEAAAAATGAGAGGSTTRSDAIIIRPQPLYHHNPTGLTHSGVSPSNVGALHSRTPSLGHHHAQGLALGGYQAGLGSGAQPHTPGGPSVLSSSPQLPFAFTPSAASLGMSLISLTDQHRTLLAGAGGAGGGTASPAGGGGVRSGAAAGSGTATAAAAGGGASRTGPVRTTSLSSGAAAAGGGGGSSSSMGASSMGGVGVGTPSPPPHVSCVRDISGLATIRRPSWSSRSSSFDVAASASLPHHLSVSPLMGDLLDPALLGCSGSNSSHGGGGVGLELSGAGRGAVGGGGVGGGVGGLNSRAGGVGSGLLMTPAVVLPGGFGLSGSQQEGLGFKGCVGGDQGSVGMEGRAGPDADAARGTGRGEDGLSGREQRVHGSSGSGGGVDAVAGQGTAEAAACDSVSAEQGGSSSRAAAAAAGSGRTEELLLASAMPEESESDILPFAIDTDACLMSHHAAAAAGGGMGMALGGLSDYHHQQRGQGQGQHRSAAAERDVAVGAFVRLVQEAAAAAPFQRVERWQQQQQQGLVGCEGQQQQQPLLVGDALQQVQQLAAQLQDLVFSGSG